MKYRVHFPKQPKDKHALRFMTWNALAPSLLQKNKHLYTNCRPDATRKETRLPRIIDKVKEINPDVLAMQEVENITEWLSPAMHSLGFEGVFKQRIGNDTTDGIAIFVRSSRLQISATEEIEYKSLSVSPPLAHYIVEGGASRSGGEEGGKSLEATAARRKLCLDLHKPTVALLLTLKDIATGKELLVGCTHILFNPNRGLVKLSQVDAFFSAATRAARRGQQPHSAGASLVEPSIVLMGDFNCSPKSILYKYMNGRAVREPIIAECTWDGSRRRVPSRKSNVIIDAPRHALAERLRSAYAKVGEPACTSFSGPSPLTVDYIWYERDRFQVAALLPTPNRAQMFAYNSLPHEDMPSDHVPLACDLQFLNSSGIARVGTDI